MGTNQIRRKAFVFQLLGCSSTAFASNRFGLHLHHPTVHTLGVALGDWITKVMQRLRQRPTGIQRINPQGHQLMTTLARQTLNDMDVLTGEVLVNEKDFHPPQSSCKDSALSWNPPSSNCR